MIGGIDCNCLDGLLVTFDGQGQMGEYLRVGIGSAKLGSNSHPT